MTIEVGPGGRHLLRSEARHDSFIDQRLDAFAADGDDVGDRRILSPSRARPGNSPTLPIASAGLAARSTRSSRSKSMAKRRREEGRNCGRPMAPAYDPV
jgi:hypothetical protein